MKYFIRSIKYLAYIVVIFLIIINVIFYTSTKGPNVNSVMDLFKENAWWQMAIFFVAVSAIYPLFGFYNKKFYVNKNFADKKQDVINIMTASRYVLSKDQDGILEFRLKSKFLRFMRLYEDAILVIYANDEVTISGLRKDVVRVGRQIEALALREEE